MAACPVDQGQQVLFLEFSRLATQGFHLVGRQIDHGRQFGIDFQDHQVAKIGHHAPGKGLEALAAVGQISDKPQGPGRIVGHDGLVQLDEQFGTDQPEGRHHGRLVDDPVRSRGHLVQKAQPVAHTALCQ